MHFFTAIPFSILPSLRIAYGVIAWIFIVIDVGLLVGLMYVYTRALQFRPSYEAHHKGGHEGIAGTHWDPVRNKVMRERWQAIVEKFEAGTPGSARMAIIDADALVDSALKGMQVEGEHLADRLSHLESGPEPLKSMPRIWRAHRLRNALVHTSGLEAPPHETMRAMRDYESFLREIKVIE